MATTSFFRAWPVWAKLSFALASSLVVVLMMAGLVKLRKMIKISKIDKKAAIDLERANTRLRGRSSDEIPFGAKAMLEDPDVEGVWNSRASTPLQSPVLEPRRSSPSRNPFSRSRRNSSVSSASHLSIPDDNHVSQPKETEKISPGNLDGTSGGTPLVFGRNSVDTPWQYKVPVPYAQNGTFPRRRSVTIRATSAQDVSADGSTDPRTLSSSIEISSKRRSRVSTDPMPATPTHERHGRSLIVPGPPADPAVIERTPTTRKALDRMEAHRKFHAAESGQLQPRLRSLDERVMGHKHSASDQIVPEHETTRAVSWPITSGEVLVDFKATQKVQTKTSPHVIPFRAFVEMHQPSKVSTKLPPSAWTERTQGMLEEKLESQAPRRKITIKNDQGNKKENESRTLTRKNELEDGEELASLLGTQARRVNKGFEVLPAGSLNKAEPVRDFGYETDSSRNSNDEKSRPKKLQKRNRSRSNSRSRNGQKSSVDTVLRVET